jgi:hypothetical protein
LSRQQKLLWCEHYAHRIDPQCKYHKESFQHYFQSLNATVQPVREMMIMQENASSRPTRFLNPGAPNAPFEAVEPGVPLALLGDGETMPTNRLELARWLSSDHHPQTARVAVNHIWQQMFGHGLVETSEDLGLASQPPTHPELLDYLARELIQSGWSRKAIVRKIALSQAFAQASQMAFATGGSETHDATISHYPAKQLTEKSIRDGALQVGELLSERLGGAPAFLHEPAEGLYRRSLYTLGRPTSSSTLGENDPQFVEACTAIAIRALGIERGSKVSARTFETESVERALRNIVEQLTSLACEDEMLVRLKQTFAKQRQVLGTQPKEIAKWFSSRRWNEWLPISGEFQLDLAALAFTVGTVLKSDEFTVIR